ncbi:MAG: TonB-dependent receptor, partial [Deltaproteobacteria bacterium]|nr:TonB-dependent receptor [Deltaproteobacteria bacterium]
MKKYLFVVVLCAVFVVPRFSLAEGEKKDSDVITTMQEVVVTGTRTEQSVERIPANVTVIYEEDIDNSNARTVSDVLRSEEGIVVRDWLSNGKTAQVDLRGFGETANANTLVLVDGRRVNEIDLSGTDWTQIPLEQIERIEIVRGTGTVLYGDNAVGGVINIITKSPSEKLTFSAGTTASSYGRNKEKMSISGREGNIAASLFSSYDSTNGYRDNSQFRAKDIGGKIVFDPIDFLSLNLSGSYHSDNYGLPGDLSEAEMAVDRKASNEPFNEAEVTDQYLKLGVNLDLGKYGKIVTDLSYRDRENDQWFFYPPSFWNPSQTTFESETEIETWSITPRYVLDGKIFTHENTFIAGVDVYSSQYDQKTFFGTVGSPPPSGLTDIDRDALGFYFNNEFAVLENLFLSVGARRERVRYELNQEDLTAFPLAPLDDTVTERENAYSAGLTFQYSGKSSVFLRANRSLRFPLTDELVVWDYVNSRIDVNTDLKPQTGKHYEAGIRHYFTPNIQGNVTLFRAEIKDEIFFNAATFTNTNHPETLHQGIEIGSKTELFNKLTLFGNYTYEKAEFEKAPFKGNNIPAVPKHKANLGFRIHDVIPGLIFSVDYNYIGSSYL